MKNEVKLTKLARCAGCGAKVGAGVLAQLLEGAAFAVEDPGYTVIPLKVFISDRGYAKIQIGVGRGKKQYDKRQAIREREDKRSMDRFFKK